jgi:hypothetical protein
LIAFRKLFFIVGGLVFWTGEGIALFAGTPSGLGWGLSLIVAAFVLYLLNSGPAAALAGTVVAGLTVALAIGEGDDLVACALYHRFWMTVPPIAGLVILSRKAFWAIERADIGRRIERRHW